MFSAPDHVAANALSLRIGHVAAAQGRVADRTIKWTIGIHSNALAGFTSSLMSAFAGPSPPMRSGESHVQEINFQRESLAENAATFRGAAESASGLEFSSMQRRHHPSSLLIAVMASTLLAIMLAAEPVEATDNNAALAKVASIHGAAGPFAVIGYRMGLRALAMLDAPYGSFDLDVIHRTPLEVQYSCIADGVQAATGVSVGKLNLRLEKSTLAQMETIVRNKATGKEVVFHLKPEAISRFLNLPHDQLERAGREVMDLPDDQLFSVATHE